MNSRNLNEREPSGDHPETREHDRPEAEGDDGGIVHFSHPEHRLARFDFPYLFMCMGCKEYGAGKRFMCQTCGFQLHEFCALAPPSLHDHPFHTKHQHLLFFDKPAGTQIVHTLIWPRLAWNAKEIPENAYQFQVVFSGASATSAASP
jgi:hypothetical protein